MRTSLPLGQFVRLKSFYTLHSLTLAIQVLIHQYERVRQMSSRITQVKHHRL